MQECLKIELKRHKKTTVILTILVLAMLLCTYFALDSESSFYNFFKTNQPNEAIQSMRVQYDGEYSAAKANALISTYEQMKQSKSFTLYEYYDQYLEWIAYDGPEQFVYGYEHGIPPEEMTNRVAYGKDTYITTNIKSAQLDLQYFERLSLSGQSL